MQRKSIYRIGVALIAFSILFSPFSYLLLGKVVKGRVIENVFENSGLLIFPTSSYPKIEFRYNDKIYTILGEENQIFLIGDEVKVIFYTWNPQKGKVFTFSGLFIDAMIQLPIGLLIWWALFKSYPNLFNPPKESEAFENPPEKKRRNNKIQRLSESHIMVRVIVFTLITVVILSFLFGLWTLYKEMTMGTISIQVGIGISVIILVLLAAIFQKIFRGKL